MDCVHGIARVCGLCAFSGVSDRHASVSLVCRGVPNESLYVSLPARAAVASDRPDPVRSRRIMPSLLMSSEILILHPTGDTQQ